MGNSNLKFYKLRLMLLNEWKLKSNVDDTTKKINEKFGKYSITSTKVQEWFDCFNKGDISLFGKNSELNVFHQNKINTIDSVLFLSGGKQIFITLIRYDNRFIEYSYEFEEKQFIARHDLFLDVKKEIEVPFKTWNFEIINGFLLVFDYDRKSLRLLKIDYEHLNTNLLDSIECTIKVNRIIADQLNPNKFVIYNNKDRFPMGEIWDGKIVLSDVKQYDHINFYGKRLMGSNLQGFYYNKELKSMEFREINLDTLERKNVNVAFVLEDDSLSVVDYKYVPYCWSENCFYGMFEMSDNQNHLLMFNSNTLKWTDIQVVTKRPRNLFVDQNEILRLQVGGYYEITVFYRIALRKPDSLKNLTHLAILKHSNLFGNDKYLSVVRRLPI